MDTLFKEKLIYSSLGASWNLGSSIEINHMIELIHTVKRISNDNKIQSCDLFVNAITWLNLIGESKMELYLSFIHLFIMLLK